MITESVFTLSAIVSRLITYSSCIFCLHDTNGQLSEHIRLLVKTYHWKTNSCTYHKYLWATPLQPLIRVSVFGKKPPVDEKTSEIPSLEIWAKVLGCRSCVLAIAVACKLWQSLPWGSAGSVDNHSYGNRLMIADQSYVLFCYCLALFNRSIAILGNLETENKNLSNWSNLQTSGPFLKTPDNFPGPVSIFSSSFICKLMVIIGANLAICFTKLCWD